MCCLTQIARILRIFVSVFIRDIVLIPVVYQGDGVLIEWV